TVVRHVARYGAKPVTDALLALMRADVTAPLRQFQLFRAYEQGTQERGAALGDDARRWASVLTHRLLGWANPNELLAGVSLAGTLRLPDAQPRLVDLAASPRAPEPQRVAAFNSLVAIDAAYHVALLGRVLADASEPAGLRVQAS